MEVLIATNNQDKLKELQSILKDFNLKTLNELEIHTHVLEDQKTYEENAQKKAKEIYNLSGIPTIADDSGLNIETLDNFPGIETHRFAGITSTDEIRNTILLDKMQNKTNRKATFVTILAYYDGKHTVFGKGYLNGNISNEPKGNNGFGFDTIFEYNGKTLAQLTAEEKNKISARKLAAIDLRNNLKKSGII